jgi:type II secretory pathway predicted ATPase ExeA
MQPSNTMFQVPPFPSFPAVGRYVNLGATADALQRVVRSVDAREGISLIIGPPGTGKTLLCGVLYEHFHRTREVVLLGGTPIESSAAFLRRVLHALEVPISSVPDGDLQLALIDRACAKSSPEGGLLIVVDEGQSMPVEVLESIRMSTNIMRRGEPRVCAVVCGGPQLDEVLALPALEPFTQRVATRCYLHPLTSAETRIYIRDSIARCGADPDETITEEAMTAVHHACGGVPRLINQLMTQAVDCAETNDVTLIGIREVNLAWSQLLQLPGPIVEEPQFAPAPVEFGSLSDFPRAKSTIAEPIDEVPICNSINCEDLPFESESITEGEFVFTDTVQSDPEDTEIPETDSYDRWETAPWIEEPGADRREQHVPPTDLRRLEVAAPLPSTLFGDFEEEEEIMIGGCMNPTSSTINLEQVSDLEAMLHEEIVGMTSDLQLFQSPDTQYHPSTCDDCVRPVTPQSMHPDMHLASDDSDILIIEDDIEVQASIEPISLRREESPMKVNFQSMLTRMRASG